jgi:hypothetical protein
MPPSQAEAPATAPGDQVARLDVEDNACGARRADAGPACDPHRVAAAAEEVPEDQENRGRGLRPEHVVVRDAPDRTEHHDAVVGGVGQPDRERQCERCGHHRQGVAEAHLGHDVAQGEPAEDPGDDAPRHDVRRQPLNPDAQQAGAPGSNGRRQG